ARHGLEPYGTAARKQVEKACSAQRRLAMLQDREQRLARAVAGRPGGKAGRRLDAPATMPTSDDSEAHPEPRRAGCRGRGGSSTRPPICSRSTLACTSSTERLGRLPSWNGP